MGHQFKELIKLWEENQHKVTDNNKPKLVSKNCTKKDFFGVSTLKEEESTLIEDARYWNEVNNILGYYNNINKISEGNCKACDPKTYVDAMSKSPNPIRPQSIGKDTDIKNDVSTNALYDPFDLDKLISLKHKLDDLLVKLNSEQVSGKNVSSLEKRIVALTEDLDKLSESLGKSLVPSQQGD